MDWQTVVPEDRYPPGTPTDAETLTALDAIRDHCGWHIFPQITQVIQLDPTGSVHLILPSLHIKSVDRVEVRGETLSPGDYQLFQSGSLVRHRGVWGDPVTITLTHGFTKPPRAVLAVAKSITTAANAGGLSQLTTGPFSMTAAPGAEAGGVGINDYHARALESYRLGHRPW